MYLLWASMQACGIIGLTLGFLIGLRSFLIEGDLSNLILGPLGVAGGAMLIGPAFALPAIVLAAALSVAFMKKGWIRRSYFFVSGAVVGVIYGFALDYFTTLPDLTLVFAIGGGLTGIIVQPTIGTLSGSSKQETVTISGNDGTKPLPDRDAKRLRRWVWVFLAVGIVGVFAALEDFYKRHNPDLPYEQAQRASKDPMAVVRQVRINGVDLWIPVAYFESRIPSEVDQKTVLLIALYPEFEPLKQSKQQLWEQGEWYRNVRWLIQDASVMKSLPDNYTSISKAWKATEFRSVEYGLNYYTQPLGQNGPREIWLEGTPESPESYIECGKKNTERTRPQCSHSIWANGFRYRISYDKKLLPQWREIRDKTLSLTEEFKRN